MSPPHLYTVHSAEFGVLFHLYRTDPVVRLDRCRARVHIGSLSCSTGTEWLRLPYLNAATTKQKRYVLCTLSVGALSTYGFLAAADVGESDTSNGCSYHKVWLSLSPYRPGGYT